MKQRIELRIGDLKLAGNAAAIFLGFTSPWFSSSRDTDHRKIQTQVAWPAVQHADVNVPTEFTHFQEWVILRRVDLNYVDYNEDQWKNARRFLTAAVKLEDNVHIEEI